MVDTHITKLAIFTVNLIGKNGGIKFNTQAFDHNYELKNTLTDKDIEKLENEQIIIIGNKSEPITQEQVKQFLEKLDVYLCNDSFDNGRSYCFEGIQGKGNNYYIAWGS